MQVPHIKCSNDRRRLYEAVHIGAKLRSGTWLREEETRANNSIHLANTIMWCFLQSSCYLGSSQYLSFGALVFHLSPLIRHPFSEVWHRKNRVFPSIFSPFPFIFSHFLPFSYSIFRAKFFPRTLPSSLELPKKDISESTPPAPPQQPNSGCRTTPARRD